MVIRYCFHLITVVGGFGEPAKKLVQAKEKCVINRKRKIKAVVHAKALHCIRAYKVMITTCA